MTTRETLIESTRELLWERGYTATSPRAILDRAGVGQGSMYHHFSGKAELAAEALRRNGEALRAASAQHFDSPGTVTERITSYLLQDRDALKGCRIGRMAEDPEVVSDEALRAPLDETLGWHRSRLAELLAEGQATGELSSGFSPVQVGTAIAAVVQGGYVLAKAAQASGPFDDAIAGAVALVGSLRADAAQ